MRYVPTPRTAVARLRPKPTNVGMYTHSTIPSPPGVIGMTPITLAKPERDEQGVGIQRAAEGAQEHPQRRRIEQPGEGGPGDDPSEQLLVLEEILDAGADLAHGGGRLVLVPAELLGDRPDDSLRPALAVDQSEDDADGDEHHDDPGEGGHHVQAVGAADRDGDEQGHPQHHVEHDGRADAGRRHGEPGVGAAHPRQA